MDKIFPSLGASNHSTGVRETNDFYATEPKAMQILLDEVKFNKNIWEPACGQGHLSKVLIANGYDVISTDLIDRGYGDAQIDFLDVELNGAKYSGDIITNPPYKLALEFCQKALDLVKPGNKVAMFLKLLFLESKRRKQFFLENPPKTVYVSSSRIACAINGDFTIKRGAIAFAWYVWEKGFSGDTVVKWIN